MTSASERIRQELVKQAAERAAREAAERKAEADRRASEQRAKQQAQDEHKRKLQRSKEVADRVLRESGVLAEIQAIKRDHIDGKFKSVEIFMQYTESNGILTLAWGNDRLFIDKDGDGNSSIDSRNFANYEYLYVTVDSKEKIGISNGSSFNKFIWRLNKQVIVNALADAFLNPNSTISSGDDFRNYEGRGRLETNT